MAQIRQLVNLYDHVQARCDAEVQELRQWQLEWREINENVSQKVNHFWDERMPRQSSTDEQGTRYTAAQRRISFPSLKIVFSDEHNRIHLSPIGKN